LEYRLYDNDVNNFYDQLMIHPRNMTKLLKNYEDLLIFSIYIGIKNLTKQEIYIYLERVIKILDEQWLYRNNINYKYFQKIFQIFVDNI